MSAWTQSYAGNVVTPMSLKEDQVAFADIGHALSQKTRFNGHLREFYSVAQHCVLGAGQIAGPYALAFLLHEVGEVMLPDVPSPIKGFLTVDIGTPERPCSIGWGDLEARHADVIFKMLGLSSIRPLIDSKEVHEMDLRMLATEKRDLMGPEPQPWNLPVEPLEMKILTCWKPADAERYFNEAFYKLSARPTL